MVTAVLEFILILLWRNVFYSGGMDIISGYRSIEGYRSTGTEVFISLLIDGILLKERILNLPPPSPPPPPPPHQRESKLVPLRVGPKFSSSGDDLDKL